MQRVGRIGAEAERFREMRRGDEVLDSLEACFRSLGATGFLVTGVPLPGRPVEPMVLRRHWPGSLGEEGIAGDDALLVHGLACRRARVFDIGEENLADRSGLYRAAVAGAAETLVSVPVDGFQPFQGLVLASSEARLDLGRLLVVALEYLCEEAFRQLLAVGAIAIERPGDLSGRERRVVALSAAGKTASDIAEVLAISQRTVHAHLQNASDKLRARNKTQTVVEALRYGQITL